MQKGRRLGYGVFMILFMTWRMNIYLYQNSRMGNLVIGSEFIRSKNSDVDRSSHTSNDFGVIGNYDVNTDSDVTVQTEFKHLPKSFLINKEATPETSNFIIRPWKNMTSPSRGEIFMFFFVKSSCIGQKRRENVRRTWGSIREINKHRMVAVFLIGRCFHPTSQTQVLYESLKHGDILQADVSDNYRNLPSKVLSGYQWATQQELSHVVFYATTDDDCLIKLPSLFDYYVTNRDFLVRNSSLNCGFRYNEHGKRHSNASSKYLVSRQLYDLDNYPAFCHGGLTVMTYPLMRAIYRMSEITNRSDFFLEDVYINGILREKMGNGSDNINTIGSFGLKGTYVTTDDVVVHLGGSKLLNIDFELEWTKVLQYMTLKVGNETFQGYRRSSVHFSAESVGNVNDLKTKFFPKSRNPQESGRIAKLLKIL